MKKANPSRQCWSKHWIEPTPRVGRRARKQKKALLELKKMQRKRENLGLAAIHTQMVKIFSIKNDYVSVYGALTYKANMKLILHQQECRGLFPTWVLG